MTSGVLTPETAVLDHKPPQARCQYCHRPFDTARSCALHIGEVHSNEWTEDEQLAYEDAVAAEEDELWMYHMKIVVGLGVTYAIIVLIYMIVLG